MIGPPSANPLKLRDFLCLNQPAHVHYEAPIKAQFVVKESLQMEARARCYLREIPVWPIAASPSGGGAPGGFKGDLVPAERTAAVAGRNAAVGRGCQEVLLLLQRRQRKFSLYWLPTSSRLVRRC